MLRENKHLQLTVLSYLNEPLFQGLQQEANTTAKIVDKNWKFSDWWMYWWSFYRKKYVEYSTGSSCNIADVIINHRITIWVGKNLKDHLVPTSAISRDIFHCPRLSLRSCCNHSPWQFTCGQEPNKDFYLTPNTLRGGRCLNTFFAAVLHLPTHASQHCL